jgi:hypothetical protein
LLEGSYILIKQNKQDIKQSNSVLTHYKTEEKV